MSVGNSYLNTAAKLRNKIKLKLQQNRTKRQSPTSAAASPGPRAGPAATGVLPSSRARQRSAVLPRSWAVPPALCQQPLMGPEVPRVPWAGGGSPGRPSLAPSERFVVNRRATSCRDCALFSCERTQSGNHGASGRGNSSSVALGGFPGRRERSAGKLDVALRESWRARTQHQPCSVPSATRPRSPRGWELCRRAGGEPSSSPGDARAPRGTGGSERSLVATARPSRAPHKPLRAGAPSFFAGPAAKAAIALPVSPHPPPSASIRRPRARCPGRSPSLRRSSAPGVGSRAPQGRGRAGRGGGPALGSGALEWSGRGSGEQTHRARPSQDRIWRAAGALPASETGGRESAGDTHSVAGPAVARERKRSLRQGPGAEWAPRGLGLPC